LADLPPSKHISKCGIETAFRRRHNENVH
jgi:hypothetical protein